MLYRYSVIANKRERKKHVQLTLDQARKPIGQGGWRPGAGRPSTRTGVSHDKRVLISANHPQHVTGRIVDGIPALRQDDLVDTLRACIAKAHRDDFRIVHFSIESNHMHSSSRPRTTMRASAA